MTGGGARRTVFGLVAVLAVSALGIALVRPRLLAAFTRVKAREDVYVLPPPAELKRASLGYEAALADMLWAQLLVEYGRHWAEKRPFPDMEKYIDAIIALDPASPSLYRYVDTLLVFRPTRGTEEDARKARAYLERGVRERPYDHAVWLQYGQFVGFLAPSFLSSEEERERWRVDGSEALFHAAELGAVIDRALTATSVLSRAGRHAAAIEYLRRAQALTQDPATLAEIEARLARLEADSAKDSAANRQRVRARQTRALWLDARWGQEAPFVSRGEYILLGPMPDPLVCTGPGRRALPECADAWDDAIARSLDR